MTERELNVNTLGYVMKQKSFFVKTIALLLAALVISGCGGAESRKAKYLAKGKAYIEEKNYDKAKIEVKNALQIDPKYAEGFYLMGVVEEKRKNMQAAFGNYSKALELDPAHVDAKTKLGFFHLMVGNTDKAKELIAEIQAAQPDNPMAKTLHAAG